MEVFATSRRLSHIGIKIVTIALLLSITAMWAYSDSQLYDKALASFALGILFLFYFVATRNYQVLVDAQGIVEKRAFRTTKMTWHEIDDVLILQNVTIIKSSRTSKAISIFHPSPHNIFHQIVALNNHDKLRDLILLHSIPFLKQVWSEQKEQRVYNYPSPSLWVYVLSATPILAPILAVLVFDDNPLKNLGWPHVYLLLPFVALSAYLAYRLRAFRKNNVLVLNDLSVSVNNGTHISISWAEITSITETPAMLGLGSITIRSETGASIVVPKEIDRFYDMALQIKKRVPQKFDVQFTIGEEVNPG